MGQSRIFLTCCVFLFTGDVSALAEDASGLNATSQESSSQAPSSDFSIKEVLSAPFVSEVTAAPEGDLLAWVQNTEGTRNVWVASAPDWNGYQLSSFTAQNGQPIEELTFTPNGNHVVFIGGDPNPTNAPKGNTGAIYTIPAAAESGSAAQRNKLADKVPDASNLAVDPSGSRVAFHHGVDIWFVGLDGASEPKRAVKLKGEPDELTWSPEGQYLAFQSDRETHSLIGLYNPAADTLRFPAPSIDKDSTPTWSPNGKRLAWIRTGSRPKAVPMTPTRMVAEPWSIQLFNVETEEAREVWSADKGYGSHSPRGLWKGILWTANDRLVFPWEKTGWMHLYSVPVSGGKPIELTPGEGIVQDVALTSDRQGVVYSSNHGDIDRRHLWRVSADGTGRPAQITSGDGIEWGPQPLADGGLAFVASGARIPAHPEVMPDDDSDRSECVSPMPEASLGGFPRENLVKPRPVVFRAADGKRVRGQLFLPLGLEPGEKANRPAIVFIHGGPRRQMLLGWHYMNVYQLLYGMNQWLAGKGYVVLSVNYRGGIGYGLKFREADGQGLAGASEFNDILGAGLYLQGRSEVNGDQIGLWGGSYGGYLTALGLARASDLFAAGVDFSGVHNWYTTIKSRLPDALPDSRPSELSQWRETAFEASPVADVEKWRSPVLFVHGDLDPAVPFYETVRMLAALRRHGKADVEQLVFPNEGHNLLFQSWLKAFRRAGDFFDRKLLRNGQD